MKGRPTTLPPPWAAFAAAAGGVGKLAATLGVSRRTIDRWGAGTIPNRHVQEYVIQEAKKLGVTITWI